MTAQPYWADFMPSDIRPIVSPYCSAGRVSGSTSDLRVRDLAFGQIDFIVVVDWTLTDRLEMLIRANADRLAYGYCAYVADQKTWLEPVSGGVQEIAAHEIALLSFDTPMHTISTGGTRHLSFFLPRSLVLNRIRRVDEFIGTSLRLDRATQQTLYSLLEATRSSIRHARFDLIGYEIVGGILSLLSMAVGGSDVRLTRSTAEIRREQIAACIRRKFSDPDFNAGSIARELGLSPRYLQKLCASGPSLNDQIRQYRLRKAAQLLQSPSWRERSVTDICYSSGFNSNSHFCTEFKKLFGVRPKDYRSR